ncbi:DUF5939 domain-containing protein [Hyalangium gracile]|uniref:DUF5939 domain-containing protein n=1 Tax=Hyalangium gracile TaxID=394092 RepID=UPI001CCF7EB7|nr:DUF5939 domain-containing protein [Hyalangium gracile]
MAHEYSRTQERHLPAPPELVWGFVADTNRWDRLAGFKPTQYRYTELEAEGERVRARVGHATQSWGEAEWLERGEWVEGQRLHGLRHYLSGPMRLGGFRAELQPSEGGVQVSLTAYMKGDKPLDRQSEHRLLQSIDQALTHYLDSLERLFKSARDQGGLEPRPVPAVILARHLLGRLEPDGIVFGLRSQFQEKELQHRAQRFASAPVSAELRERIVRFARDGFDDEVGQIRPFELARIWGFDRRQVLRGFLHAARAGLYELRWQLECPGCRGGAQEVSSLESLPREGYCIDCDRSFGVDFASNVEASFQVSPAIRAVNAGTWCVASPWFRPHILANFIVPPHGRREVTLELPRGAYSLRTAMRRLRTGLPVRSGGSLQVTLDSRALEVTTGDSKAGDSRVTLVLVNSTPHEEEFSIERADWEPEVALGRDVLAVRDFHELFSTEAPSAGMALTTGSMVVLFSDLTGSTALYEKIGDARAFALIEQHFRIVSEAAERHSGSVLKTMGDSVMATFLRAGDAFAAALELSRETERLLGEHGLRPKIGIHEGPCLAVRANQRLDLFGTTMNLAARLQAEAKGGQVVVLSNLTQHPDLRERIERDRLEVTRFEAELRVGSQSQACVAVTAWEGSRDGASSESR